MSSTNVHSNPCIVGGDTNFTGLEKQPVEMRQYNEKGEPLAGKGPSRLEIKEGPNTEILTSNNIVVKDENKIIGRATTDGKVLSGSVRTVKKALQIEDMEK